MRFSGGEMWNPTGVLFVFCFYLVGLLVQEFIVSDTFTLPNIFKRAYFCLNFTCFGSDCKGKGESSKEDIAYWPTFALNN